MRNETHTHSNRTERTMSITANYQSIAEANEAIEAASVNADLVILRVSIEIDMPDHVDHGGRRYHSTGKDSSYRISQPGNKMTPMPAAEYRNTDTFERRLWLTADGTIIDEA